MSAVEIWSLYGAWVSLSGIALWALARWCAQPGPHIGSLPIAATITLICVVSVLHAFTATGGPPTFPSSLRIAEAGPYVLLVSFLAWPFVICAAVAHISCSNRIAPRLTRSVAFTFGIVVSLISPFALLAAGCGLAGACL